MSYVCFKIGHGLGFGEIVFERLDLLVVDEINPGTCYTPERRRPVMILPSSVIGRGARYDMQDAANAGNDLLRPRPSMEAVVSAAQRVIAASLTPTTPPDGEGRHD